MYNPPDQFFVRGDGLFYQYEASDRIERVDDKRFELMWYSGVQDKDNTAIFEGDIVERRCDPIAGEIPLPKYQGAKGVVTYEDGGFFIDKKEGEKWAFYGPEGRNFTWNSDILVINHVFSDEKII